MISGVCAPFDHTECHYNLQWVDNLGVWGQFQDRTILFNPEHWTKTDCFGLTVWQHEWLHAEIGPFHYHNDECMIRDGFQYKFENSWMVTHGRQAET